MTKIKMKEKGFTLIEILVVIVILGILSAGIFFAIRPLERIREAQLTRARVTLDRIGLALREYNVDSGGFYPDELEGVPEEVRTYISDANPLNEGPWPGSYYDYDNYTGLECTDAEASGSIQVSIRNVPYRNPDGSSNWTLYYVIEGKGTPNCIGADWNKGECVNCGDL